MEMKLSASYMNARGQGHFRAISPAPVSWSVTLILFETTSLNLFGQSIRWVLTGPMVLWLCLDLFFLMLAGNRNMHQSLDEFEFRQNSTATDFVVSCPWAFQKSTYKLVRTLAPSFFIVFSSFLQVIRTTIQNSNDFECLNFNQIGVLTAELAALYFWMDLLHSCSNRDNH